MRKDKLSPIENVLKLLAYWFRKNIGTSDFLYKGFNGCYFRFKLGRKYGEKLVHLEEKELN